MKIGELLDRISELYKSGDELTPDLISELQNAFIIRDDLRSIMSLDLESTSKKMKDLLVANGYTIDSLERIKPYVSGNDVYKLSAFIASMKEEKNEFYISSAAYYNKILNETADFYMYDAFNSCVSKLVDRGYSKKNVMKSIFDYSSNGAYDLGESKGVVVRLVRSKAPIIQDAVKEDVVEESPIKEDNFEKSLQNENDSLIITDKDREEVKELLSVYPGLRDDLETILKSVDKSSDSAVSQLNGTEVFNIDLNSSNNPDDSKKAEERVDDGKDVPIMNSDSLGTADVDYINLGDYSDTCFSDVVTNPFEKTNDEPLNKISRIAKKVKRKISKPDFNNLKMKMLKSFMKLMSIDSSVLKQPQSDSIYTDYSFDDDININGRSR